MTQSRILIVDDDPQIRDWAQLDDSQEIKTHEDVLFEEFVKLSGS